MMINNLDHYADILAIPLFIISSIYFYRIKNKKMIEYFLLMFSVGAAFADIFFTAVFLKLI